MSGALTVLEPGLQSTVQAGPRRGARHLGVPASGAADPLSLALANRAVGNDGSAAGIEVTLSGAAFRAEAAVTAALAGAPCQAEAAGASLPDHEPFTLEAGDELRLSAPRAGCRTYLALRGGVDVPAVLGSQSTYLPAGIGGVEGRTLREGDRLAVGEVAPHETGVTPTALRPAFAGAPALRCTLGPEAALLAAEALALLFAEGWRASRLADRTGVRLDGPALPPAGDARMPSVATLPGTVQLPPGGAPIVLGPDGGTTGGYPRVAQVIRADRHLIGQLRPGATVRLLRWEAGDADAVLAEKTALLRGWLGPGFRL